MTRRVLVTGAASGLGAALTTAFRARGDEVLATDLTAPGGADSLALDVRSDADWSTARAWVAEHWGGLDVLVNNAGVAGGGRIDVCTLDEWQWLTDINLFGVVRGTRAFAPRPRSRMPVTSTHGARSRRRSRAPRPWPPPSRSVRRT